MATSQKRATKTRATPDKSGVWRKWILSGAGIVAFLMLITVVLVGTLNEPQGGVPEGTEEVATGDPLHVEGELYDEADVPAGGEHSAVWANCGFYSDPIEAENAVHSMEHGAVWITYQPILGEPDLEVLRRLGSPVEKVLVSPVADQASPIVATAWGSQLELDSIDDPRLEQFVVEFAGALSAPEPGGACTGGVGIPQG